MIKKTLVEVNYSKLSEDSVIVFQNGKWVAISKTAFLDNVHKDLDNLENKMIKEFEHYKVFENSITNRIKDIEDKIKIILGEDENEEKQENIN